MSLRIPDPQIPADVVMPRDEDVARMIDVIEADALLVHGTLVCAAAGHCALGALLFATGMSNYRLAKEGSAPSEFTSEAAQRLLDWYRLDEQVASEIVNANDGTSRDWTNSTQHDEVDFDPKLIAIGVEPLSQPSEQEMRARKELVIRTIREAVASQRIENRPSGWGILNPAYTYDDSDR